MKLGLILEGKTPPDKRVPLSPQQCVQFKNDFPNVKLVVQSSSIRKFKDEDYIKEGIQIVDSVNDCDIILGVKEVPINRLVSNKTQFFFSHTIKKQPYNRDLLLAVLKKNITLIDWETITNKRGTRLIGFGRYAGIVGTYNGFLAWGKKFDSFNLKAANQCEDRAEMELEYTKIKLPNNTKIVITGAGRVAHGAMEVLNGIGIKKVTPQEYLTQNFNEPIYTQLLVTDYNKTKNGTSFKKEDFYKNGSIYESDFMKWATITDLFIPCHYYQAGSPYLFTREDAKSPNFKIKVVADISCDIDGPVASTIRPSTIAKPLYGYNPQTESEVAYNAKDCITVMAVDNLPCELPKDASIDFGSELLKNVLPCLLKEDTNQTIDRATMTKNGKLYGRYTYLQDFVEGK